MNTSRSAAGAAMLGGHIYVVGKVGCKSTVYTMYTHAHVHPCTLLAHTYSVCGYCTPDASSLHLVGCI